MIKSDNIEQVAAALIQVQSKLVGVKRTSENPFFHSRYADLSECWDTIRPLLAEAKLCITQMPEVLDGNPVLTTLLIHESGEFLGGTVPILLEKQTAQSQGSGITYARRYGLMAIVGLSPVDDDGNQASAPVPEVWDRKDWKDCPVHIGKHPGTPLGRLDKDALDWLKTKWEPADTPKDRQLLAAVKMMSDSP